MTDAEGEQSVLALALRRLKPAAGKGKRAMAICTARAALDPWSSSRENVQTSNSVLPHCLHLNGAHGLRGSRASSGSRISARNSCPQRRQRAMMVRIRSSKPGHPIIRSCVGKATNATRS